MIAIVDVPAKRRPLVDRLIEKTKDANRIDTRALAREIGVSYGPEFKLAWQSANRQMLTTGAGFSSLRRGGIYVKATTAQKMDRAGRRNRSAARTIMSVAATVVTADLSQVPEIELPEHRRKVERIALKSGRAAGILLSRKRDIEELPTVERPKLPRGAAGYGVFWRVKARALTGSGTDRFYETGRGKACLGWVAQGAARALTGWRRRAWTRRRIGRRL